MTKENTVNYLLPELQELEPSDDKTWCASVNKDGSHLLLSGETSLDISLDISCDYIPAMLTLFMLSWHATNSSDMPEQCV